MSDAVDKVVAAYMAYNPLDFDTDVIAEVRRIEEVAAKAEAPAAPIRDVPMSVTKSVRGIQVVQTPSGPLLVQIGHAGRAAMKTEVTLWDKIVELRGLFAETWGDIRNLLRDDVSDEVREEAKAVVIDRITDILHPDGRL